MRGTKQSVDDVPRFNLTRQLATRQSIEIPPSWSASATTVDGRHYSKYGILMSLVMIPMYGVGKAVGLLVSPELRALMDNPVEFTMYTTNQWLGALACALLFLVVRAAGYRDRTALWVTLAVGVSSMLWFYTQTACENVLTLVLLEIALLVLLGSGSLNMAGAICAGCATGFIFLTRWGDGWILLPGLAALLVTRLKRSNPNDLRRRIVRGIAFAVPVIVGIGFVMIYNYARFFDPFELGYDDDNVSWRFFFTGLYGFLFSPTKSVFLFSPLLILAVLCFGPLWRRLGGGLRATGFFWLIGGPLIIYSLFEYWHGGWCFGPRYLLLSVVVATIALGEWLEDPRWSETLWRPFLFFGLVALGAYTQVVCLGSDFSTYGRICHPFLFDPYACPLFFCPKILYQPNPNFWFIRLLNWPGISLKAQSVILLPLAFLGIGIIGLRLEISAACQKILNRIAHPSPTQVKIILGVVALIAAAVLIRMAEFTSRMGTVPEGTGLKAHWFANAEWRSPPMKAETVANVDFDFSATRNVLPDRFSLRCEGQIAAPSSGTHVFGLDACGTATLWLDEQIVIRQPGNQRGSRLVIVSVPLSKGWHPIRVEYASSLVWRSYIIDGVTYERPHRLPFGVTLRWKPPGTLFLRTVPRRAFRPVGKSGG